MFLSNSRPAFLLLAILAFATSVSAQRYYGRDHHVFHRPPPPMQARRSQSLNTSVPRNISKTKPNTATATAPHDGMTPQNVPFHAAQQAPKPPHSTLPQL